MITAAVLAVAGLLSLSTAAGASTPLPRISANSNCWHGSVKPHHVYTGQGIAPQAVGILWSTYGQHSADGNASFYYPSTNAGVRTGAIGFWRVRTHGGIKFFTRMSWNIPRPNGTVKEIDWVFRVFPGGTCPGWDLA